MYIIFIVIFVTSYAFSHPFWNIKDYDDTISKCLYEISQTCLFNQPTVFIYDDSFRKSKINANNDIADIDITKTLSTINYFIENRVPIIISNDINNLNESKEVFEGSPLIVARFEDIKSLSKNNLVFHVPVKYIIIIDNSIVNFEHLSRIASEIQTYDVTFVLPDQKKGEHVFITTIPTIDENSCGLNKNSQLTHINSCINGSLEKKNIEDVFPSTVPNNLKLCPFNIGMATMFPYSIIPNKDSLKNLDPVIEGYGSDIEMVKIIANNINATLNMYYIYREEENPYLHLEYLHFLLNGSLDACAGGLYRIYGDTLAYSGIYTIQSVIWVYTVEREIRSWQSIAHKINDIYYFVIVYIIYSIIWNFIKKFDMDSVPFVETILSGWGALVGASSLQEATSMKQKMLNIVYLIMSLHLSAYIGAQIYSYLTIQGPPQVYKTADELRASDKKPYLQYSAKFFVDDREYESFANTSGDCKSFKDCEDTIIEHNGATVILEAYLLPFQADTSIHDEARVLGLPETLLTVYHEFIIRKDFSLGIRIPDLVTRIFEAGICEKLYNEAIGITVVDRAKISNKNILSNSYSCTVGCAITLDQLGGAFYIWLFGCFLSCFVFLLELLLYKRVTL